MSFERSYSIESHERIKLILIFGDKKPTFDMVGHIFRTHLVPISPIIEILHRHIK